MSRKMSFQLTQYIFFTIITFADSQTYKDDSLAVREILDSNGLSNVPVYSVSDSSNGRITALNLRNKNLSRLVPAVGRLTQLKSLELSQNSITYLPPEIGNCENLLSLIIAGNKLVDIPSAIGKLKMLFWLDLAVNQIVSLPQEIGSLIELTSLSLSGNKLITIPNEIGNLSKLLLLDINVNQLQTIPKEIGKLVNLLNCNMWQNKITALPDEIGELNKLGQLDLSDNLLDSLPRTIGKMSTLVMFNLRNNNIRTLPEEIMNLDLSKMFDINYNRIDAQSLSPTLKAWLDKNCYEWQKTQKITGIGLQPTTAKKELKTVLNNRSLMIVCEITGIKNVKIDLFNTKGVLVGRVADNLLTTAISSFKLPIEKLGSGLYFLRVFLEGHLFTKQIIITE